MGSARVPRAVVAVAAATSFFRLFPPRLVRERWNDEVSGATPETTRRRRVLPIPPTASLRLRVMRSLIIFAVIWFSFTALAFWWIDFNVYRVTETGDKILKDEWTVESRIAFSCVLGLLVASADMFLIWVANVILDEVRRRKRNEGNLDSA
jgi:hypothetical protein